MLSGFLQVVVVFCLWGIDVSRAYVFQASRPSEGGDNPPSHTKSENTLDVLATLILGCWVQKEKSYNWAEDWCDQIWWKPLFLHFDQNDIDV